MSWWRLLVWLCGAASQPTSQPTSQPASTEAEWSEDLEFLEFLELLEEAEWLTP